MKYLFYLGHPAHFHLFKPVIQRLKERGHEVTILIKQKDILEDLLQRSGWPYLNILKQGRGDSKVQVAWSLLVRDVKVFRIACSFRPDLMVGTSAEITHVGKVLGIPSLVVNEDDYDVVPLFAKLAYPFATAILAPTSCRVGRWQSKTITYAGYHELAYLHPAYFTPGEEYRRRLAASSERYFILRFAKLNAHHDSGRNGIDAEVAAHLVKQLEPHGRVYITAERVLEPQFEKYRIRIDPQDMHSALYYAHMYIGDSQTMAAEAAVLGVPSLRFNDFVGEIGYLEELEHRYGLTFGIRTTEPQQLHCKVDELLKLPDLKAEWADRRQRMLHEKIDVSAFIVQLLENDLKGLKGWRNGHKRRQPSPRRLVRAPMKHVAKE